MHAFQCNRNLTAMPTYPARQPILPLPNPYSVPIVVNRLIECCNLIGRQNILHNQVPIHIKKILLIDIHHNLLSRMC